MPELPEVEVLARHLRPFLRGKSIRGVEAGRGIFLSRRPAKTAAGDGFDGFLARHGQQDADHRF